MPHQSSLPFDGTAASVQTVIDRALPVPPGHLDELGAGSGALREPWARFFEVLGEEGFDALDQQTQAMARQIRDNGVTYNVYADQGAARPWALNLFPYLISEQDWQHIERGVAQRATLANAIMADIYGDQTLLAKGLLPAGLVYGSPGYLRPMRGYVPPGGDFLHIVAVDLAHAPDGGWTVMSHRTETPSGMGYALENRLIVSSLFADAFRELRVRRLPPAFAQLVSTLAKAPLAPAVDRPARDGSAGNHIVLLTPGPYNETYFEHTFLARYLGITLVEGKDLTVRDDVLYLKTFAGLERVDVVLRRLDDVFCDPLELRPDSTLGVPGLLETMRAGNVLVSNAPGSGFLESAAIHGFLPAIATALLGEPLMLPGVSSWWCGEAVAREEAFNTLTRAFVMPTYPRTANPPLGMELGVQSLDGWRQPIEQVPDLYTLQAELPLSHAPRWEGRQIGSRAAMLRVFAVADGNGGWHVMPGGFTRLAGEGSPTVSMQRGGSSVDTWVLSSQPVAPLPMPAQTLTGDPVASSAVRPLAVSSRAAENLFWAGRYAERAENNVRLCRQILGSIESSDDTDDSTFDLIDTLARQCGLVPLATPELEETLGETAEATAPSALPTDPSTITPTVPRVSLREFERTLVSGLAATEGWSSVGQNLAWHARAASEIRNRLSNDHWRTILAARNDFEDAMAATAARFDASAGGYDRLRVLAALEHLAMQLSAVSGAQGDRMSRDEAWRLLFIGRHIERLATLSAFLRSAVQSRALHSRSGFDLLLHLFDSTLTFRALYPGRTDMAALVDLLVIEPTNPRGLYGVYDRLRAKLGQIAPPIVGVGHTIGQGSGRVPLPALLPDTATLPSRAALCEQDASGNTPQLTALCEQFGMLMAQLSDEITARYFSHANSAEVAA